MDLVSAHSHSHDVYANDDDDDHMPTSTSFAFFLFFSFLSFLFSILFRHHQQQQQQLSKCICGIENKIQHHFFLLSPSLSFFLFHNGRRELFGRERKNLRVCVDSIVVIITISLYNIVSLARNNSFLVRLYSRFVFLPCELKDFL